MLKNFFFKYISLILKLYIFIAGYSKYNFIKYYLKTKTQNADLTVACFLFLFLKRL